VRPGEYRASSAHLLSRVVSLRGFFGTSVVWGEVGGDSSLVAKTTVVSPHECRNGKKEERGIDFFFFFGQKERESAGKWEQVFSLFSLCLFPSGERRDEEKETSFWVFSFSFFLSLNNKQRQRQGTSKQQKAGAGAILNHSSLSRAPEVRNTRGVSIREKTATSN